MPIPTHDHNIEKNTIEINVYSLDNHECFNVSELISGSINELFLT